MTLKISMPFLALFPLANGAAPRAVERGANLDRLVAFHLQETTDGEKENGNPNGGNGVNVLENVILQRAVNIIVALQLIGTL